MGPSKKQGWPVLDKHKVPEGFQGKVFKDRVREGGCGV